ncbi:MAG: hypothetical protein ACRDDL_00400, partial [Sarcina sp.]
MKKKVLAGIAAITTIPTMGNAYINNSPSPNEQVKVQKDVGTNNKNTTDEDSLKNNKNNSNNKNNNNDLNNNDNNTSKIESKNNDNEQKAPTNFVVSNSTIKYGDLEINVGTPTFQKVVGSSTSSSEYQPSNSVPATGDIVTAGTKIAFSIPVSLMSSDGKKFNVSDFSLSASPTLSYSGVETPEAKEQAAEILKEIKLQLSNASDLTSTSSFMLTGSISFNAADWGMNYNPNITINFDGHSIPVQLPVYKLTNKYKDLVSSSVQLNNGNVSIGFNNYLGANNNLGIYNPNNHKLKSLSFKISSNSSNVVITPHLIPGITYNSSTGEYTITGNLLNNMSDLKNIFSVSVKNEKESVISSINVQPTSVSYEGLSNSTLNSTTNVAYTSGSTSYNYIPKEAGTAPMTPMSQSSLYNQTWYHPTNTYTSVIGKGLGTDYKIYSGSLVVSGQVVVKTTGGLQVDPNQVFVHLDSADMQIMENGTAEQKAELFKEIVSGNPTSGIQKFTASQIQNTTTPIPAINFVYNDGQYTAGNSLTVSGWYTPISANGTVLLSKVMTLGIPVDSNQADADRISGTNATTDYVSTNNGKVNYFYLGDNNKVTVSYAWSGGNGAFSNGVGKTTSIRCGEISHNASSMNIAYYYNISTSIDNNTSQSRIVSSKWLGIDHTVQVNLNTSNPNADSVFTKNTTFTINMGAPFELTGSIKLGNVTIGPNDYKIEGNKIIITCPEVMSATQSIQIPCKYTDPNTTSIAISAGLGSTNPQNPSGIAYNINNNLVPKEEINSNGIPSSGINIGVLDIASNGATHSTTGVTSTNNALLSDEVFNDSMQTQQYVVVGQLPVGSHNSLPGNSGEPSQGGLGAKLTNIASLSQGNLWVLPADKLSVGSNNEIVTSSNPLALKGSMSWITNPASGWVKYHSGMNLSNIIGYAANPTIPGYSVWRMQYNVKLTGVTSNPNNNNLQYATSQFKYYDENNVVGSDSNIVVLTPAGISVNDKWSSSVLEINNAGITSSLSNYQLNRKITYQGKTYTLKSLISNGNNNDGLYDLTPDTPTDHLQQNVNMVNNAELMKLFGYEYVKTIVKNNNQEQNVNASWFENTGILGNSGLTIVQFYLKPLDGSLNVQVNNASTGEVQVANHQVQSAPVGSNFTNYNYIPPVGYSITGITLNGEPVTASQLASDEIIGSTQNIVYTISKEKAALTVGVYNRTTEKWEQEPKIVETGVYGDTYKNYNYSAPSGYKIVDIRNQSSNGDATNISTETDLGNLKLGAGTSNIIYIIQKEYQDTVKVNVNGKASTLVASQTGTVGVTGEKSGITTPVIPKGYKILGITVNGTAVNPSDVAGGNLANYKVPATIGNTDTNIVYNIGKEYQDTVKVLIDGKAQTIVPNQTGIVGVTGEKSGITTPVIPKDYEISGITVNGTAVNPSSVKDGNLANYSV